MDGLSDAEFSAAPLGAHLQVPVSPTLVMGILNVTPDSFSDGGQWVDPGLALVHAQKMVAEGADIIDIGGESTRPGAVLIPWEQEWERVRPILPDLVELGVPISIDTFHSQTARRALDVGVEIVNDISGGLADPQMAATVAAYPQATYICQHYRGMPSAESLNCDYNDLLADLLAETLQQIRIAEVAGIDPKNIVFDPGLGFSLTSEQCWQIVEQLAQLRERVAAFGYRLLIGASRKRFIKERFGSTHEALDRGTLRVTSAAVRAGVWAIRVHEVAASASCIQETFRYS